jgi:sortase A
VTTTTDDPVVTVASVEIEPTTPVSPGDADTAADEEAFGSHWFDDRDAIPQVLLWGAVTAAIAVGAYQIAKRFRNSWIGLALGVVPFLVTLYFFYQNVNRLLPAAL